MSIVLRLGGSSIAAVSYFANGSKSYPKETLEIYSDGRVLRIDNFRITRGYGFPRFRKYKTRRQDKGHHAEVAAFVERVEQGGERLIALAELENVTRAAFAAVESARSGKTIVLRTADER